MEVEIKNPVAEAASQIAKDAAVKILIPMAIKKIVKQLPFFALPVINPIFVFFFERVGKVIYDEEALLVYMTVTNMKAKEQGEEARQAIKDLQIALEKPVTEGNEDEIKRLSEEFDRRMGDAIKYDRK